MQGERSSVPNEPFGFVRLSILSCKAASSLCPGLDVKLYHDSSILYKSLFLFLDLDGDSADHQDNLVRFRGNILVEPALHIGKFTLHLVYRHASHTQLVRHEDQVGILLGEFIELRFEEGEG